MKTNSKLLKKIGLHIFIIGGAIIFILPFLWMISTSFKTSATVLGRPIRWIPEILHFENYPNALSRFQFGIFFMNSGIVTITATLTNMLLSAMAGYGLAKFHFKGRDIIFILILSTMMLPIQVVMVPLFLIIKRLNMLNSLMGLIVPFALNAFGVFLMRQYIMGIPDSLLEAARIDGASELKIFFKLILPLTKPALATLGIFWFREVWDAYIWPLIIITKDKYKTIPLGLAMFESSYVTRYHELMAVAAVAILPMVILFFFMQRAFVRGMVMSGIKD